MKWYQHISDSLDDPFIFDLVKKYKGNGYLVFFGCLEILAREESFDESLTVSYDFLSKKLQLSAKVLKNILNFIAEKGRFEVVFFDSEISIFCPKLKALRDYKHYNKEGSDNRKNGAQNTPKIPLEREKEKEKEIKSTKDFRVKEIIDYFFDKHLEITGNKVLIDGGKDGKTIKGMLATFGPDDLKRRIIAFLTDKDKWLDGKRRDIGMFKSQINKYGIKKETELTNVREVK